MNTHFVLSATFNNYNVSFDLTEEENRVIDYNEGDFTINGCGRVIRIKLSDEKFLKYVETLNTVAEMIKEATNGKTA